MLKKYIFNLTVTFFIKEVPGIWTYVNKVNQIWHAFLLKLYRDSH